MADKAAVIRKAESILKEHKTQALVWSEQPSSAVRAKITQHFDEAAQQIKRLLQTELE
jgi:hypothetical protein